MASLNVNKVILGGRLVKDPALEETGKGTPVCNILLAINGKSDADFIEATAYGDSAKDICDFCQKGTEVLIEAKLKYNREVGKIKVKILDIQFVGGIKNGKKTVQA